VGPLAQGPTVLPGRHQLCRGDLAEPRAVVVGQGLLLCRRRKHGGGRLHMPHIITHEGRAPEPLLLLPDGSLRGGVGPGGGGGQGGRCRHLAATLADWAAHDAPGSTAPPTSSSSARHTNRPVGSSVLISASRAPRECSLVPADGGALARGAVCLRQCATLVRTRPTGTAEHCALHRLAAAERHGGFAGTESAARARGAWSGRRAPPRRAEGGRSAGRGQDADGSRSRTAGNRMRVPFVSTRESLCLVCGPPGQGWTHYSGGHNVHGAQSAAIGGNRRQSAAIGSSQRQHSVHGTTHGTNSGWPWEPGGSQPGWGAVSGSRSRCRSPRRHRGRGPRRPAGSPSQARTRRPPTAARRR